jgi:outer membrane protein assembly factor BamA
MRSLFSLLAVAAAIAASANAGTGQFAITGNSDLSSESIIDVVERVSCTRVDSVCVNSVCRAVADYYWSSGYLNAEVTCRQRGMGDTVHVSVSEGSPSVLRFVRARGYELSDTSYIDGIFGDQIGKAFSPSHLEQGISEVLRYFDSQGYPLCQVTPELISMGDGWIGVELKVDEGPRAVVGGVVFEGLNKTKPGVLLTETGLVVGQSYDGGRIDESRQRLLDLGVFQEVSEPALAFDGRDTSVTVSYDIVEARTSVFEGVAAYTPRGEGTRFVGSLDLELGNLGGTLRRLHVLWKRPASGRLSWSIRYREPRILSKPFAAEVELSSDVIDTSYARRRFWAGLTYRGEPRLEIGAGGFLAVTKDRTVAAGEGNFDERGLSFDLRYEGRDDPVNPRAGHRLSFSHEVASLDYEDSTSADRTLSYVEVTGEYVVGIGGTFALVVEGGFSGVYSSEGQVPESHRIRLGGVQSLRGYMEEWFSVEQAVVAGIEVRRLIGRYSRVFAFFDGATIEDAGHSLGDVRSAPFGYGLGFMGGSGSGLVRLEIALGRNDTWNEAKLHVSLIRRL